MLLGIVRFPTDLVFYCVPYAGNPRSVWSVSLFLRSACDLGLPCNLCLRSRFLGGLTAVPD